MLGLVAAAMIALFVLPCLVVICMPALAVAIVRFDLRGSGRICAAILAMLVLVAIAGLIAAAGVTATGSL